MRSSTNGPLALAASAIAMAALAPAPAVQAGGIVAHWSFDQTGAPIALDSVGGMNGVLVGGATMVPGGVAGGAVQLATATGSLVNMGNVLPMAGGQPMTLSAWFKLGGNLTAFSAPVARHNSGTLNGYFLGINPSICYSTVTRAWSYRSTGCGGEVSSASVANDGAWHFIAVTFHPSTGHRIYLDGGPVEGANGGSSVGANNANFLVGGIMVGGVPTSYFNGLVDDVQVYDRALTCAEINAMFQSPGSEAGPITPDLNGDGDVNGADLGLLLSSWGTPAADLNGDGTTDGADLGVLLSAWGTC